MPSRQRKKPTKRVALAAVRVPDVAVLLLSRRLPRPQCCLPNFWHRLQDLPDAGKAAPDASDGRGSQRQQFTTSVAVIYVERCCSPPPIRLGSIRRRLPRSLTGPSSESEQVPILPAPPATCDHAAAGHRHLRRGGRHVQGQSDDQREYPLVRHGRRARYRQTDAGGAGKGGRRSSSSAGCWPLQPACEILLRQVYRDWCRGGQRAVVRAVPAHARVVVGIEAIHYFFSGPGVSRAERLSRWRTTGHAPPKTPDRQLHHRGLAELDENVTDILLKRALNQPGKAAGARAQLVAVRTSSNDSLQIGRVQWARQRQPRPARRHSHLPARPKPPRFAYRWHRSSKIILPRLFPPMIEVSAASQRPPRRQRGFSQSRHRIKTEYAERKSRLTGRCNWHRLRTLHLRWEAEQDQALTRLLQ